MLTCKIWTWVCRVAICDAFLVGECVLGNENTTEYGSLLFFLIEASTKVSDVSSTVMVSKVAYTESFKRLEKRFRFNKYGNLSLEFCRGSHNSYQKSKIILNKYSPIA